MEQSPARDGNKLALVVLAFAVLLHLCVLFFAYSHPERTLTTDSPSYIEPAQYLLRDGAYTYPGALRTPIYPIFLAMIFSMFGENPFYVILAQVVIGLLTIYLTCEMSRELFPSQNNFAGIFIFAFGLESILSPFYVMTETLFTFLLVGVILCLLAYRRKQGIFWLVASGILSGLAILCRPIVLYFPGIILLLLFWESRLQILKWLKVGVIYVSVVLLCVIPWVVRNYRTVGLPVVSTITGDSLYFYSAAALMAYQRQIAFFDAQKDMYPLLEQAMMDAQLPNTERNRYNMEISMARQIIFKAPVTYFFVHVRDSLKVFLPGTASLRDMLGHSDQNIDLWDLLQTRGLLPSLQEYFRQTVGVQFVMIPFVILLFITCLGGLLGVWTLFENRSWLELMILLSPIMYLIIFSGPGAYSRFRIPLMPFLSVLAGVGVNHVKNHLWRKHR